MAGIGFDAHVVAALPPRLKRWLGKGAYVIESLRQLIAYDVPRYSLSIDGRAYDCASAVIAKGHFYGNVSLSSARICVPLGTFRITSSALAPERWRPMPWPPRAARKCCW